MVYRSIVDHSRCPRGAIADQAPVTGVRPRMGNGGSDRFEPSRVESGLQACRCKDLRWKGIRRQGWLDKGKLDVIGYRRAVSKEDDQILENFEVAGAVRISHCIERDVAF